MCDTTTEPYIKINESYKVKNFTPNTTLTNISNFKTILCSYDLIIVNGNIGAGKSYFIHNISRGMENKVLKCIEPSHKWDYLLATNSITGEESFITDITVNECKENMRLCTKYANKEFPLPVPMIERNPLAHFALFRSLSKKELKKSIASEEKLLKEVMKLKNKKNIKICIIVIHDSCENYKTKIEHRGRCYEQDIESRSMELAQLVSLSFMPKIMSDKCTREFYLYVPTENDIIKNSYINVSVFKPELIQIVPKNKMCKELSHFEFTNDLFITLLKDIKRRIWVPLVQQAV